MYEYKEKYTLNFSKIEHWSEFHQIIKDELDFPEYYGKNWDAFGTVSRRWLMMRNYYT